MNKLYSRMSVGALGALLSLSTYAQQNTHHSKDFWKQIEQNGYHVPQGASAAALIGDLTDSLGSEDPDLRDDLVYGISAAWTYRDGLLSGEELRPLLRKCESNLQVGIGEQGTDSVLLRSFSALELSIIAASNNKRPFLSEQEFGELLNAALNYMNAERDLRGYDQQKGWIHATAHTSDLLKFLGRNLYLKPSDQGRILDAIGKKLKQDGHAFVFGENERMAAALMSLIRRSDFDRQAFETWLSGFASESEALWAKKNLNVAEFTAVENAKELLRDLLFQLDSLDQPEPAVQSMRRALLASLKHVR